MEPSIHHFRRGHKQTAQIEQTVDVVEFQFIKYFLFIRVEGITKELPQKPFSWPRNNRLTFSKNGLYSSIYNNEFVAFLARMTRKNLMAHPYSDIETTCKLSSRAYIVFVLLNVVLQMNCTVRLMHFFQKLSHTQSQHSFKDRKTSELISTLSYRKLNSSFFLSKVSLSTLIDFVIRTEFSLTNK